MRTCWSVLVLMAAAPVLAAEPTEVERVVAEIEAKTASIETYSAELKMQTNLGSMTMTFGGAVRGKGALYESTIAMDMFGQKMANRSVADADGVVWTEMDMMGHKTVMKTTAEAATEGMGPMRSGMGFGNLFGGPGVSPDPRTLLKSYSANYEFDSVGRDEIDGTQVHVIGGALNASAAGAVDVADDVEGIEGDEILAGLLGGFKRVKLYIGVGDGFVRKIELLNDKGVASNTQTYSKVEINGPMADDLFTYTPPEGVEVMDLADLSSGFGGPDSEGFSGGGEGFNEKLNIGDAAPEFEGISMAGETVKLTEYRGKVVLLDFWATWCAPCVAELPKMIKVYEEFHPKGLELIGISLDDDRAVFESYVRSHKGLTWPQIFEGKGWESAVPALYGVDSIPFTLLLDKDGKIIGKNLNGGGLKTAVAKALGDAGR